MESYVERWAREQKEAAQKEQKARKARKPQKVKMASLYGEMEVQKDGAAEA